MVLLGIVKYRPLDLKDHRFTGDGNSFKSSSASFICYFKRSSFNTGLLPIPDHKTDLWIQLVGEHIRH